MEDIEDDILDFSPEANEDSTRLFMNEVALIHAQDKEELEDLFFESNDVAWTQTLKSLRFAEKIVCKHEGEEVEEIASIVREEVEDDAESASAPSLTSDDGSLSGRSGVRSSISSPRNSLAIDIPDDVSFGASAAKSTSKTSSSEAIVIAGASDLLSTPTEASKIEDASQPKSKQCRRCAAHDATVFPFVSDVAPLAILMFLEAIQNHKELSFNPMTPAYIPHRPRYLSNGMSFRVTRVPWEQVRADTEGRVVKDLVYKRLNGTASRRAWLDFMKDLVVTHHMTYHVSNDHKRNIVQLHALGWERMIDDIRGEPTLAPVIALEYAQYGTLQDLYYSSEFLSSYKQKIQILADVADGLQALHFSNIVHGDVKPANILICRDNAGGIIAKLSDFGLSVIDPSAGPELQHMPGGTAEYLAPEAFREMPRDQLKYTDVYSYGVVVWQTLLGGTMPFFSSKYANGELLSRVEIQDLKNGKHTELAQAYNINMNHEDFLKVNSGEEIDLARYEPPKDKVNDLLLAMMKDNVSPLCRLDTDGMDAAGIPESEFGALLSIIQICLSSCPIHRRIQTVSILLGRELEEKDTMISKVIWEEKINLALEMNLEFQFATARAKELYTNIFEQFFLTLQRNESYLDYENLGRWDQVMAKYLGKALVDSYLHKYMEGDHSEETRTAITSYLTLSASLGKFPMCVAGLDIHQFLGSKMEHHQLHAVGSAVALWCGDTALWNIRHPVEQIYHETLVMSYIAAIVDALDETQKHVGSQVLKETDADSLDIDYRDDHGCTLLHGAMQSGNANLSLRLMHFYNASAALKDDDGDYPIHWLHQLSPHEPEVIMGLTNLLIQRGANVEAYTPQRIGEYVKSAYNIEMYPTPLLRAVISRNNAVVAALVRFGAVVSLDTETYLELGFSPLSLAASMLEYEALDIMLNSWDLQEDPYDPNNVEVRDLWERAIGGGQLYPIDRIKIHGHEYAERVKKTLEVLTRHLGRGWIVKNAKSSLHYAVECGDLIWVEALLEDLYKDPNLAVLADLQTSIQTASAYGYSNIAAKLREFGALPLLPWNWSDHDFTVARHGKWSEELIDRIVREMYRKGEICARTTCCLHFAARGGINATAIVNSILETPVVNPQLKPENPDWVAKLIDGKWPRLDRADEEHRTPLYEALAYAEFGLAQYLINEGAKSVVEEWSLVAQLFEDARPSLPQQIEFLLKQHRYPSFKVNRRVFGRLRRNADDGLHPDAKLDNYHFEEHTFITATAEACTGFDDINKRRVWRAVLEMFGSPFCLLAKGGDGRDGLEIAIDNADLVTVQMLLRAFAKHQDIFQTYSALERVRRLLTILPPQHVADGIRKGDIVDYRLTLGKMMQELVDAGDLGETKQDHSTVCKQLLENITNEFPILVRGFQQRGVRADSIESFRSATEELINAFLTALTARENSQEWNDALEKVDEGLSTLLSRYFIVIVRVRPRNGIQQATVSLTSKIALLSSSTGNLGMMPGTDLIRLTAKPTIDFDVYRKTVIAERRVADPSNELPFPEFRNAPYVIPTMQDMYRGKPADATPLITPIEVFAQVRVNTSLPRRAQNLVERSDYDLPRYYHRSLASSPALLNMGEQMGQRAYFENVIKAINPDARNVPQKKNVKTTTNLLINHVENTVETETWSLVRPEDRHPLFGKMKVILGGARLGEVVYMDLPTQAYHTGARSMARRWGMSLSDEDDDSENDDEGGDSNDDNSDEEDEADFRSDGEEA